MTTIVTRVGKGSALTWDEMDANFTNLRDAIDNHIADTSAAHAASAISASSTTLVGVATDVQGVLEELDDGIADHLADTVDAHDASAISVLDSAGYYAATEVESALAEAAARDMGMKNRIINGDMRIDQRNNGSSTTPGAGAVISVDRWGGFEDTDGTATAQRTAITNLAGFTHCLRFTVTSADATLAATQFAGLQQKIEGVNMSDFGWGTSNAVAAVLSFWVRSSVTGTFGVSFRNSASDRAYPTSYTINSANTWEKKTVTVPGDTTGTWLTDTGIGVQIFFGLGIGSTYSAAAGAWTGTSNIFGTTGATNLMATNGATFDLTGVQFEIGSTPTPFERRSYGQELALCQRYYYKLKSAGGADIFGMSYNHSTTVAILSLPLPVTMRTGASSLDTSGTAGDYAVQATGATTNCSAVPTLATSNLNHCSINFTVAAGLTAGQGTMARAVNSTAYLGINSEL